MLLLSLLGWFDAEPGCTFSSSSSSFVFEPGVVGGGSQPGTVVANSHFNVCGFTARPAGHLKMKEVFLIKKNRL